MENLQDLKYEQARRQVKRMKGFYIHLAIFIAVNLFGLIDDVWDGEKIFNSKNWWGAGLWAIGLTAHGLSVFLPNFIFGKDWEERKIQELLNKRN